MSIYIYVSIYIYRGSLCLYYSNITNDTIKVVLVYVIILYYATTIYATTIVNMYVYLRIRVKLLL